MRRTLGQIRAVLNGGHAAQQILSRRVRAGVYLGRLGLRILAQWARDRCPQQAAALTFQATLSLVPILAITLTVLRGVGSLEAESNLLEFLAANVFPGVRAVVPKLQEFAARASAGAAGAGGVAFTLITCYTLYSSVERIVNDIWRAGRRRSLVRKFLTFYALVTLLPVLAGLYLYYSGLLIGADRAARFFGPLPIQFLALFLLNKLLPVEQVRARAAIAGTLVSGLALEGLKWGFVYFAKQTLLTSYTGIYGPLALVPLMLVWIYVNWLIVLLGVEVSNAVQNLRLLEAEDRRRRGDEPLNAMVAAQVLAFVADGYQRGRRGTERAALTQEFGLSAEIIERICERLKRHGLIAEVQGDLQGFIPGRSPDTILLADVLSAFRGSDLQIAEGTLSPTLAALIKDLDEARRTRIAGVTIADLAPGTPTLTAVAGGADGGRP